MTTENENLKKYIYLLHAHIKLLKTMWEMPQFYSADQIKKEFEILFKALGQYEQLH
jgi:hypothetical protein